MSDLGVRLEVVVQHVAADRQVTVVVRIDAVPALRSELAALTDDGVEVTQCKQDRLELGFASTHLQCVLKPGNVSDFKRIL